MKITGKNTQIKFTTPTGVNYDLDGVNSVATDNIAIHKPVVMDRGDAMTVEFVVMFDSVAPKNELFDLLFGPFSPPIKPIVYCWPKWVSFAMLLVVMIVVVLGVS